MKKRGDNRTETKSRKGKGRGDKPESTFGKKEEGGESTYGKESKRKEKESGI